MRKIISLLTLLLTLSSCSNSDDKQKNDQRISTYAITRQSAGPFALNEEISYSLKKFNIIKNIEKRYTDSGPVKQPVYTVLKNGESLLKLHTEYNAQKNTYNKIIDEIMILSPLFQTKEGIKVGSTIQKFIKTYPNYKLWYTYVSDRYILENQQQGIQFLLNGKAFKGKIGPIKNEITPLKVADFKEGTQIVKIRIF